MCVQEPCVYLLSAASVVIRNTNVILDYFSGTQNWAYVTERVLYGEDERNHGHQQRNWGRVHIPKKMLKDLSRKSGKCFVFIEQYKINSGDSLTNGSHK